MIARDPLANLIAFPFREIIPPAGMAIPTANSVFPEGQGGGFRDCGGRYPGFHEL